MRLIIRSILVLAVTAGLFFLLNKWSVIGSAPQLELSSAINGQVLAETPLPLGVNPALDLTVKSQDGICELTVRLQQGGLEKALLQESPRAQVRELSLAEQSPHLQQLGFTEGPAELTVLARDCSLYKRKAKTSVDLILDFMPPRVTLTSRNHYVNQGGADVLTYQVRGDAAWSGVRVGPHEFKGYPVPGKAAGSGEHFAFFVFSYELPIDTTIEIIARDAAGNEGKARMKPARLFAKEFRHRKINVSDGFIDTKVLDIIERVPELSITGDRVTDYLQVNDKLRKRNAQFLVGLAQKTEPKFYWDTAFKQMGNTAVEAQFADYRDYFYNGEKIDSQVHLGFDLASFRQAKVSASNDGKVLFADYLGIYGNTLVIDHGYGVSTLYAHLTDIQVKVGELVKKGQALGRTGTTGLAGGDHLHFSLLIHGVQSNPVEFWDQHWIDDHVNLRLNAEPEAEPDVLGVN